jgi:hypothetical protein
MRTTVDIPDELFRRAKSEAALQGRRLKDLVEEGLRLVLSAPPAGGEPPPSKPPRKVTAHDLLKDLIFEGVDSPPDLSTNPKYFDGFGK